MAMNNAIIKQGWDFQVEEAPGPRPSPSPAPPPRRVTGADGGIDMVVESDPNGIDQHAPGAKLDQGKTLAGVLLDFNRALEAVADVGTFGANKYSRGGWQSVPNAEERYKDAFMRHLLKMGREDVAADSNIDHLAHLAWNCLAWLELKRRREEEEESTPA